MTGLGLKEPDANTIGLCSKHHADYDQHKGIFRGLTRFERWAWFQRRIAVVAAAYEEKRGATRP